MALALHRLSATALRGTYRIRPRRILRPATNPLYKFHTAVVFRKDRSDDRPDGLKDAFETFTNISQNQEVDEDASSSESQQTSPPSTESDETAPNSSATSETAKTTEPYSQLDEDDKNNEDVGYTSDMHEEKFGETATPEQIAQGEEFMNNPPPEHVEAVNEFKSNVAEMQRQLFREYESQLEEEDPEPLEKRFRPGIMAMGEEDEQDEGDDETFAGDDITSHAHGELEQHREMRHYARIAAWEMPLLSKLAKPFELPALDRPLRFRYTSYLGEEHPAEKKVVLEFSTTDLPLEPKERLKLIKLVGVRYNPQTDIVKMSCEMFETQAQNKRYLGDLVDTLMAESKNQSDAEGGKDAFDDVAVDFRHVKWKRKPQFPNAWKLTSERKAQLERERADRDEAEAQRITDGTLIDGIGLIEAALKKSSNVQLPPQVLAMRAENLVSQKKRPIKLERSRA